MPQEFSGCWYKFQIRSSWEVLLQSFLNALTIVLRKGKKPFKWSSFRGDRLSTTRDYNLFQSAVANPKFWKLWSSKVGFSAILTCQFLDLTSSNQVTWTVEVPAQISWYSASNCHVSALRISSLLALKCTITSFCFQNSFKYEAIENVIVHAHGIGPLQMSGDVEAHFLRDFKPFSMSKKLAEAELISFGAMGRAQHSYFLTRWDGDHQWNGSSVNQFIPRYDNLNMAS